MPYYGSFPAAGALWYNTPKKDVYKRQLGYIGDVAGICRIDDANRAVLDADAALDAGVSGLGSCGVGSSTSGLVRTVARDLRSSELTGIFSSFQLLAQSLAELLGLSQILCIGTTSGDFMPERCV